MNFFRNNNTQRMNYNEGDSIVYIIMHEIIIDNWIFFNEGDFMDYIIMHEIYNGQLDIFRRIFCHFSVEMKK